jgi:lipopolysaccharide/colanic/teichoic acid biosynthesis glycosyltransferase
VLRGDMSVIGPRPEVPRYVEHYPPALRARALSVKPGISDPASIAWRDEADQLAAAADPEREYIEVILPRKIAASVQYAEQATLWSDLGVLWRSFKILIRG